MQFVHSTWDGSFKKERLRPPKSLEERKTLHWLSWFFSPYLTSLALNRRWSWRSMEQRGKVKWTLVSKSGSQNVVPTLPLTSFVTSSSRFCLVWFTGAEPSYTLSQMGCLGSWWFVTIHRTSKADCHLVGLRIGICLMSSDLTRLSPRCLFIGRPWQSSRGDTLIPMRESRSENRAPGPRSQPSDQRLKTSPQTRLMPHPVPPQATHSLLLCTDA